MKIISIRNGFECDHSSSNYEFFSSVRPLTKAERKKVSGYSSRSVPGTRKATFQYHGDFSDLPSGAEEDLLTNYFDILVSESYDWWQLAIAFDYEKKLSDELKKYESEGTDDTGIVVEKQENRIIVHIYCQIDYEGMDDLDFPGVSEEEEDESMVEVDFEDLRNLLINLKKEILKGDFSSLQAVAEFYEPNNHGGKMQYTKVGKKLKGLLTQN